MVRAQTANMGSSPPSSTEATHYGTPSTNITAMSPDACNTSSRAGTAPRFNLRVNTNQARSATRAFANSDLRLPIYGPPQLSPAAEEFTPRTATFSMYPHSSGMFEHQVSPVRNLVASSMPDVRINNNVTGHGAIGQACAFTTIRNINTKIALSPYMHVVWETFSTDENVTRTFQIYDKNLPSLHHILGQFPVRFGTLACVDNKHFDNGIVRLTFNDDRDAKQAYVLAASMTHPHCKLTQLTAKDLAIVHGKNPSTVSNYDGQLLVTVLYNSRSVMPTLEEFHNKLEIFGTVKAMVSVTPMIMSSLTFRVEYHNIKHAEEALELLQQASYDNIHFLVARYEPDLLRQPTPATQPATNANRNTGQPSLTGRSTIPSGDLARLENVVVRAMREPSSPPHGNARTGHNVVDIGRIEAGIDVRTTIMLRNIPNKVDQTTLKTLLDVTSSGEYDFMYLRIDFANNCNVGYAFINFVDPLAIISFARARAGKRWNIFSSDKIAEISYATIQGRDCLVQKFRNSSVMLEHPSYRPKLYITRPSVFAGQEEAFPDPDNWSKMRRSIDNAEHIGLYRPIQGNTRQATAPANVRTHVPDLPFRSHTSTPLTWSSSTTSSSTNSGLFAPREGQAHREEQRRRRSQFDRGTPGAEIELSSYRLTDAALDGSRLAATRLAMAFDNLHL